MMLIERRRDRVHPRRHHFRQISDASICKTGLLRIDSQNCYRSEFQLVLSKQDVADLLRHFPELRVDRSDS